MIIKNRFYFLFCASVLLDLEPFTTVYQNCGSPSWDSKHELIFGIPTAHSPDNQMRDEIIQPRLEQNPKIHS